ncbi:MAG: S-layer homology domain-containing protein [Agathobaculum butyriciproducens]|nr:S-layer homology domain-containing protein [Agathobaculum butyriciproducens]
MKNLKKVLALVLAFACAFTMFAGAAFTDQADIKVDADVVDTLVSLGIVEGFEDGSFQPNGTVTRAQMAKMIYVLRTGKSDASAYNDDKTSFTDIGSHWARGYIKYCQSLGIIAGKSNTIFAPNATVTAQEAAKMLLVTLGYDATKAGLTGSGWAARTNALADENGLLEDVNTSFTGPCPRQYAAQLIYNALDTETVVWRDDAYTNENYAGTPNKTIGQKYMGLESNDTGVLAAVSKEDGKDTFRLTVNGLPSLSKVSKDYSNLLGQEVKVLYKETDKVYGVYATDKNLAVTTLVDDIDDADKTNGKFKVDGTEYKTNTTTDKAEDTIKVYPTADLSKTDLFAAKDEDGKTTDTAGVALKSIPVYETVTLIDNNDDDKIDFGVYTPFTFAKVTYKGTDSITLKAMGGTQFAGSKTGIDYDLKDDDVTLYDGAKKDDYVLVTEGAYTSTGYTNIVKATTVSGKVAARKTETVKVGETNTTVAKEVRVGTTWYKVANYKTNTDANKTSVDDEFDFYGVNGFVFFADKTAGSVSASNIAFVDKAAEKDYGTDKGDVILANLYFADGTSKKDVTVATVNDVDIDETAEDATIAMAMEAQRLYKFSVKSNGDYELTVLSNDEKGSYDEYVTTNKDADLTNKDGKFTGVTVGNNKASTVRFSDDAVVFVKDKDDVKVLTGKSVAAWKNHETAGYMSYICGLADKTSGNYYMGIGAVVLGADQKVTGNSDVKYGMLVSDLSESKTDSTNYYNFTVWNGTENVDVKVEQDDAYKTFGKNTFIAYTEVETVDGVTEIEIENGYKDAQLKDKDTTKTFDEVKTVDNAVAVKSLDKDTISFYGVNDGKEYDLSDDLVVIGVNTEDKKGVAGVELDVADETKDEGVYFKNAVFFMDGDEVIAVFVDSKGAMYDHTKNQKMDTAETK